MHTLAPLDANRPAHAGETLSQGGKPSRAPDSETRERFADHVSRHERRDVDAPDEAVETPEQTIPKIDVAESVEVNSDVLPYADTGTSRLTPEFTLEPDRPSDTTRQPDLANLTKATIEPIAEPGTQLDTDVGKTPLTVPIAETIVTSDKTATIVPIAEPDRLASDSKRPLSSPIAELDPALPQGTTGTDKAALIGPIAELPNGTVELSATLNKGSADAPAKGAERIGTEGVRAVATAGPDQAASTLAPQRTVQPQTAATDRTSDAGSSSVELSTSDGDADNIMEKFTSRPDVSRSGDLDIRQADISSTNTGITNGPGDAPAKTQTAQPLITVSPAVTPLSGLSERLVVSLTQAASQTGQPVPLDRLPQTVVAVALNADKATLQIDPPEMGRIQLDYQFDSQGRTVVTLIPETEAARAALADRIATISQALQQSLSGQVDVNLGDSRDFAAGDGQTFGRDAGESDDGRANPNSSLQSSDTSNTALSATSDSNRPITPSGSERLHILV